MSAGANAVVMKEINIRLVRRTLQRMGEATRQQIAESTGLSTVTVASMLHILQEESAVIEVGLAASMGGRPAQIYRYNEDHAHVLALFTHEKDGVDWLYVRVANLYGVCVYEADAPLADIDLRTFEPYIDAALQEYPAVSALAFGLPGVELGGKILGSDYPALTGAAFIEHYQARYGLPVVVENDVNAASVGYCRQHQIEADAAAVYLYFPQKYPPGGGLYIDGRLYRGYSHYAGEIAGMPLGIDWADPALYESFERACEAIATLLQAVSLLLNPQVVILYGAFLTGAHLDEIRHRCAARQPVHAIPELRLAADFTLDYQRGVIEQALALLEPQTPISL